jgi:hypothetical protein
MTRCMRTVGHHLEVCHPRFIKSLIQCIMFIYLYFIVISSSSQPLGSFGQEPEPSQVTGMALVRCILGKFLEVVCRCFPQYLYIHVVKNTIYQMVSLCNMHHKVIYNYTFRPCKRAIIRLFVEAVRWLYNRSLGEGGRDLVLHHSLRFWLHVYVSIYTLYTVLWVTMYCRRKGTEGKVFLFRTAQPMVVPLWLEFKYQRTQLGVCLFVVFSTKNKKVRREQNSWTGIGVEQFGFVFTGALFFRRFDKRL